jgi:hypothetical protein
MPDTHFATRIILTFLGSLLVRYMVLTTINRAERTESEVTKNGSRVTASLNFPACLAGTGDLPTRAMNKPRIAELGLG